MQKGSGFLPSVGSALSLANKFCDLVNYISPTEQNITHDKSDLIKETSPQKSPNNKKTSINYHPPHTSSHKRKKSQRGNTHQNSHTLLKRFKKV